MREAFQKTPLALNVAYISWGEDALVGAAGLGEATICAETVIGSNAHRGDDSLPCGSVSLLLSAVLKAREDAAVPC